MAYAVSVFFDDTTDLFVRDLWRAVEDVGISDFLSRGPFHPHLTLGIWQNLSVSEVQAQLSMLAVEMQQLPLLLPSVGVFPGGEGAVFLSATLTRSLQDLHSGVHALLDSLAEGPSPYYLPDCWNPHCTLARSLTPSQVAETVSLSLRLLPDTVVGSITAIGLVETPAEIELGRFVFGEL